MGAWDESKKTKYNLNRYSHSWVINGVTNTACDFLLYILYRHSLQIMWISTRVKSIVFFLDIVFRDFSNFLMFILLLGPETNPKTEISLTQVQPFLIYKWCNTHVLRLSFIYTDIMLYFLFSYSLMLCTSLKNNFTD